MKYKSLVGIKQVDERQMSAVNGAKGLTLETSVS